MRWTVRLEARMDAGEVEATELATFSRPAVAGTLAETGLMLSEAKALLAMLQASMVRGQVAAYGAARRICTGCEVLWPLKDRRTRRLQTLVRHGRGRGTTVPSVPVHPVDARGGVGNLAGLRAAHGPLHAGAGAGAGRALGRAPRFGERSALSELCCPPQPRTMRACAPACLASQCSSMRPTGKRRLRWCLVRVGHRLPGLTRARPPSCWTVPTCARCRTIRPGASRRSAARSSVWATIPGASLWCAAWPSGPMPCCARRRRTRAGRRTS